MKSRFIRGFTLVELAVVLVLIGIVMTLGLKMVVATLDNAAYTETKSKQETIKIALIGFLRSNGSLPCPDRQAVPTGQPSAPCTTDGGEGFGVVPWQTLGLSREAVLDGFGNFFSYRVANGFTPGVAATTKNWTTRTNLATDFTINELRVPNSGLRVTEQDGAGVQIGSPIPDAVVILVSHGRNGFGATTIRGTANAASTVAEEITNARAVSLEAVIRPVGESFDDLVVYMRPADLLQPLINEGSLKACVAYCNVATTCTCAPAGTSEAYCTGSGPACTNGGALSCGTGSQCQLPGAGCVPTLPIPVGVAPATCS